MKYNEKYGRWFTKGGLVYRYSKSQDKLILCKQHDCKGYKRCYDSKQKSFYIHRAIYETFVGEIAEGYEIDHINTVRDDNSVDNLRLVTHAENNRNPLTRQHISESRKGKKLTNECKKKISEAKKGNRCALKSKFGIKYFEHFGYSRTANINQYSKEYMWYVSHNKVCRWEK